MRELKVANDLFGDPAALEDRFAADGYLFFRELVDPGALAAVRAEYLGALREAGVVDQESVEPVWNGMSTRGVIARMRSLSERQPWKILSTHPGFANRLRVVMGEDYCWLPLITYRLTPPLVPPAPGRCAASRFVRAHQDGHYNPHLEFVIFWLPLMLIDDDVGGLAVAEGRHDRLLRHDTSGPTMFEITRGEVPDGAWARAEYRPGDMLVLSAMTPHTGITNLSDRFRLSIDFRLTPRRSRPILGTLLAIDGDGLSIHTAEGERIELRIDDETAFPYRRGSALRHGGWIPRAEVADYLAVGQSVLATEEAAVARLVRGFDVGPRG